MMIGKVGIVGSGITGMLTEPTKDSKEAIPVTSGEGMEFSLKLDCNKEKFDRFLAEILSKPPTTAVIGVPQWGNTRILVEGEITEKFIETIKADIGVTRHYFKSRPIHAKDILKKLRKDKIKHKLSQDIGIVRKGMGEYVFTSHFLPIFQEKDEKY